MGGEYSISQYDFFFIYDKPIHSCLMPGVSLSKICNTTCFNNLCIGLGCQHGCTGHLFHLCISANMVMMGMTTEDNLHITDVKSQFFNIGLDILPTFCDYAGIKAPGHLLGHSLKKPSNNRSFVASENDWTRMIRTERYKYCAYKTGENRESLVDLEKDPGEMINLAADKKHKPILNQHRKLLKDWVKDTADTVGKEYLIS